MFTQIRNDLVESKIDWKIALSFIIIAYLSYIFHEFGHWLAGELLGNDMQISLNNASPKSGYFIENSHALWSAIGGPAFTILQALIFLFVVIFTKSVYAYSVVYFAVFLRFFSITFGGISLQDEARIASMLDLNKFLIVGIVLIILFTILWQASKKMNFNLKIIGYYSVLSVFSILIVISTNHILQ